jgi:hypothetical protein
MEKKLRHEMYKSSLFEEKATINSMRCIRRSWYSAGYSDGRKGRRDSG